MNQDHSEGHRSADAVHWGQARIPDGLIRSDVPAGTHTGGFRDEIDGCC
jgi:hypothetical protein